jgi:hypothetical protein
MRLSVIVTCTQPWPEVRACLDQLVPQACPDDVEVIVADGSKGGSPPTTDAAVVWIRSPGLGPHELRFVGLSKARGEVVAITEDHCDVAPDWCEQVLAAHSRHPDAVAIAGPITNGAAEYWMDRASFYLVHAQNLPEHADRPRDWFPPAGSNASFKRDRILPLVQQSGDLELVAVPQLWSQGLLLLDQNVVVAHSQSMRATEHVRNHFHAARSHAGLVAERGTPACRRALARDALSFPRRLLGATLRVGDKVPQYRSEMRRALPGMTVLALAATAGYLAGITGPGKSLSRMR